MTKPKSSTSTPPANADGVVVVHQHQLPLPGALDVVGVVEIADRLRVEQQTVAQWHYRAKGRAGAKARAGFRPFPPARWIVSGNPAWFWPDVEAWALETGRALPSRA